MIKKCRAVSFAMGLCALLAGFSGAAAQDITISRMDFAPVQGGFNPRCNGELLQFTNVKQYRPIIELQSPPQAGFAAIFRVMERRNFWPDQVLSEFQARFEAGSRTPSQILTVNFGPNMTMPIGAPPVTMGNFWLGCTKKCLIRGGQGRGDDAHADVYLKIGPLTLSDSDEPPVRVTRVAQPVVHSARCTPQ